MKLTSKQITNTTDETKYEVTVEFGELKKYEDEAFETLSKDIKIQGFRPGKAPRAKIEAKLGSKLVTEAVGRLLPAAAIEVINTEKMRPVAAPQYDIQKIDPKEGIVFTMSFTNFPEIKLGDISEIKVKKEVEKVTDEDVDTVIRSIVRSTLKPEQLREFGGADEAPKTNVDKKAKKSSKTKASAKSAKGTDDKPDEADFELNDKIIEALGYEKEKTLDDVRKSVRERLEGLKKDQAENKYANDIVEKLVEISKFEVPKFFLEREVENMEKQFKARLEELNLEADTYLETQGTSEKEQQKKWEEDAKKKISIDLVLMQFADENKMIPTDEEVEEEIRKIDDPKAKASYENEQGREYIRSVMARQKAVRKLMEEMGN